MNGGWGTRAAVPNATVSIGIPASKAPAGKCFKEWKFYTPSVFGNGAIGNVVSANVGVPGTAKNDVAFADGFDATMRDTNILMPATALRAVPVWADHGFGGTATCTALAVCSGCGEEYGELAEHDYVTDVTAPTCTEDGFTTHTCAVCEDEYTDTVVTKLGHIGGTATCTESAECEVCEEPYGTALGHDFAAEFTIDKEATCTEAGSKSYHCSRCDEKDSVTVIAKLNHTPGPEATCTEPQICTVCETELETEGGHIPGLAATCTAPQICSVCKEVLAPATGHTPGAEATCTENQQCTVCFVELNPAKGHTPGPAATCTEPQTCTVCEAELEPAKGHTPGPAATCIENQQCTVCFVELVPAKGHAPGAAPTCTAPQACTVCSVELVPAKGHTPGPAATCTQIQRCTICQVMLAPTIPHTSGAAATCTENQQCTVCQIQLAPALGHSMSWSTVTPASCTQAGLRAGFCNSCDYTATEPIAKTDHTDADGDGLCDLCGADMSVKTCGCCEKHNHWTQHGSNFMTTFFCFVCRVWHNFLKLFGTIH